MADFEIRSLRIAADMDTSKYTAGMAQKVAADKAGVASSQSLGQAIAANDSKISQSGDVLARLSKQYVDGYGAQQRFAAGLRDLQRGLDSGKVSVEAASTILVGMNTKLGLTADASVFAAKGQAQMAAAVTAANAVIDAQAVSLSRAAGEYQIYIAQLKEAQALENQRQFGAANQNNFNGILGVQTQPSTGARASASVFEAEFARLEQVSQLKAVQIGQNFGDDLESSLITGIRKSARDAASVFEAEFDQLDKIAALKAQQIGGNFQQDLNARFGIGRPVNSAAASAGVFANGGGNKLSSFQLQGLGFQANDVVTMALLGAPASQIAFSQGGQILQNLQMGEGGISGSLSAIKGSAASAGAALVGTLGVVGSIATGFGVAAVAAGAFYLLTRDKSKDLNEALKDQKQAIDEVAKAYDLAKVSSDNYNKSRGIYAGAEARQGQSDLSTSARSQDIDVLNKLAAFETTGQVRGGRFGFVASGQFGARSRYSAFASAIDPFAQSVNAGHPDYDALAKGVQAVVQQNPALKTTGDEILNIAKAGNEAAAALKEGADALARINSRAPSLADSQLGQDYRDQNNATLYWLVQQRNATIGGIGAMSPEQRRQAAMAEEAAKPSDDSAEVKDFRVQTAGAVAYAEAIHALNQAQEERKRSLDQTIASAKLDLDLVGKTTAEVEGLRMAAQLEAQVREEAARNNVKADEIEIANIRAKASEYGKLIAIEQARQTIKTQQDDIEVQRAELGLVGQSTLAHDRAIASLKAEQEIRKLGIPLYGHEAEAIRANTKELADLAEASAKAKIQQDLLFDLRQMGRSAEDQSVASQLRSAGLPEDLDSDIAKVIKMRDEIARMKDTWNEVFQTARDGIDGIVDALFDGGSISEALKKMGRDFARQMFDLAVTNPLKNWLTGSNLNSIADMGIFGNGATSGRGGGFGGVLGNLIGAQKAVASMQVQAASVFINGSPLGVPGVGSIGNLLGGNGSTFTPNTTLSDLLGYGATNTNGPNTAATAAKLLSGLGSPLGFGTDSVATNSVTGGGVAGQVWNFFAGKGLQPHQIAGILGNVSAESAFNPLAVGDGGNALGLFQWNDRAPAMLNAIGGRGNLGDVGAQLNFAWKELQSTEGTALQKLMASTDVRGATSAFAGFERPKGFSWAEPEGAHNFLGRLSGAQDALSKFGSTASSATSAVGQLGGASSGALSNLVSSTSQAAGGLNTLGSGAGKLGSMLSQFPAAPGGGGGGLGGIFGSLFGSLGGGLNSAFSGTAAYSFLSANPGGYIGLYADGTESAPPGWAWVGEKGPELKKLRAGDVIRSNPRSVEMMKQAAGGGSNDNIEATLRKLAPMLKTNVKNINVFDPSVVGDYLNTAAGEEVIMNVLRRNGK